MYLVAGDIHGSQWNIKDLFDLAKETDCTKILSVGDFGYFPNLPEVVGYLNLCSALVQDTGIELAFVDGNHENHERLNQFSGDSRIVWPGIEWLYRGKIFENICSMGGAYSIDKQYRTQGVDWFPGERICMNDYYSILGKSCEILLSHDCPLGLPFGFKDEFETKANRNILREIVLEMKPRIIIHGHFHKFHNTFFDFGYGKVRVIGLNKNDTRPKEQCVILNNGEVEFL